MKLASLRDGSRDGQLAVVSRDMTQGHFASAIAGRLQTALDDWDYTAPLLEDLYQTLNEGKARHAFPFEPSQCMAPLPRAYQWVDGSAYLNHVELVRRARGAELPDSLRTDPLMYQGGSDDLLGPRDDIAGAREEDGIDFEAEVAVITGDAAIGTPVERAGGAIRLLALVNDVSLRNLVAAELAKGFGFLQSKPATAFAPVAVTPDEAGGAWNGRTLDLPLIVHWNGRPFGRASSGVDMAFDFPQLIAHLCKTRNCRAGSIVGGGTVSNRDASTGCSCIAEARAREMIATGEAHTPYLKAGDVVRIEMLDAQGASLFGAIEQKVVPTPA